MRALTVATITSANYWPYTRVLADSLLQHAPGVELQTLVVQLPGQPLPDGLEPNIRIHRLEDVAGDRTRELFLRFGIFELANALKGSFLRHLIDRRSGPVLFLDSDIRFYDAAAPLLQLVSQHDLVLTPNVGDPSEVISQRWEIGHLAFGVYNGGFIGVRDTANARRILDWWSEHCLRFFSRDVELGVSDQRWLDLVPGLFAGVHIHRDAADNAAVWNIEGRPIHERDGRVFAGDRPLRCFHFHLARPGLDPATYFWKGDAGAAARNLVAAYVRELEGKDYRRHAGDDRFRPHDTLATSARVPAVAFRAMRDVMDTSAPPARPDDPPAAVIADTLTRDVAGRSRLRVLAYHRGQLAHHRDRLSAPHLLDRSVERYRRSAWFRARVDWWYYWRSHAALDIPLEWSAPSSPLLRVRRWAGRIARGAWRASPQAVRRLFAAGWR